jgi:hypothetical protein
MELRQSLSVSERVRYIPEGMKARQHHSFLYGQYKMGDVQALLLRTSPISDRFYLNLLLKSLCYDIREVKIAKMGELYTK